MLSFGKVEWFWQERVPRLFSVSICVQNSLLQDNQMERTMRDKWGRKGLVCPSRSASPLSSSSSSRVASVIESGPNGGHSQGVEVAKENE